MDRSDNRRTRRWIILALVTVTVAVYCRVINFGFVNYDDPDYITENKVVKAGLSLHGIIWAFTHCYASNWHPLTWISHMLDYQLFAMWAGGHHLVNVLFHTANAVILFVLLYRLTGAQWRSAAVAALFALHPLHVESVAWVSERKDVLSTFFGLLSLLAYARYVEEIKVQGPRFKVWRRWALVYFALGLLAKPMLVTLPFVLLLLDFWPLERVENYGLRTFAAPGFRRIILEKWPWFGLTLASCVMTFYAQKASGVVMGTASFPALWRLVNALEAYVWYIQKLFWPADLAVFYPLEHVRSISLFAAECLLLALIISIALWNIRKRPFVFVGALWFFGTLVPVIGLVQVGFQNFADRYSYIPSIGIFIAAVWWVAEISGESKRWRAGVSAVAGLVLALYAAGTIAQVRVWQSSITLFTHAVAVTHDNALANNDLGTALAAAGKPTEALAHYAEAVRIEPGYMPYQYNLAAALARAGQTDAAIDHYLAAIRTAPDSAQAYISLGTLFLARNLPDEATNYLARAVQIDPASSDARNNLASALLATGKLNEALTQYAEALRLDPANPSIHFNAGLALVRAGKPDEAATEFGEAVRLHPGSAEARYEFGRQLFFEGKGGPAVEQLTEAIRLKPIYSQAEFYLGLALLQVHQIRPGLEHLDAAENIRPDWPDPINTRAWVMATSVDDEVRNGPEAVRLAQRAVKLTSGEQPLALNTLAAAYAETGDFENAITAANQAVEAARRLGQTNLISRIEQVMDSCKARHPFRENP